MKRIVLLALTGMLLAGGAVAQEAGRGAGRGIAAPPQEAKMRHIPAKEVSALTERPGGRGGTAHLGEHEGYSVEYATRIGTRAGGEVHVHWTHYMHVLEGEAVMTYGGTLTNMRDIGGGQLRGDDITGGATVSLRAGDYVEIPAGMPHSVRPGANGRIRYVLFNTRE